MGKSNQGIADMKTIREADEGWLRILFGGPYGAKSQSEVLEGRGAKELKVWLKKHQKVKLVTRDRASAYASAINEILPDCVQVAELGSLVCLWCCARTMWGCCVRPQ